MGGDQGGDVRQWHCLSKAHADAGAGWRIDDVPRFGFAVRQTEVATRELTIGVQMHRQALP